MQTDIISCYATFPSTRHDPVPSHADPDPQSDDPYGTVAPPGAAPDGAECSSTASGVSRFRIVRLHAHGGLGQVSVAIDEELGREVALKEIQAPFADDLAARARFVREAEITGALEHPGVVPVYGLGVAGNGRPYYAMRFIQGRSFHEAIEEYHRERQAEPMHTTMRLRELLRRLIDTCNAIDYAHSRGIIHRDLKPGNVMLGQYGETLVVDWGLAKKAGEAGDDAPSQATSLSGGGVVETLHGSALGTPQYMSPEQARGEWAAVGPASDVYSLGATLYHLLVGKPPFLGNTLADVLRKVRAGEFPRPREALSTVPPALEAICMQATALLPSDRHASARALAAEIEHWLADEPVLGYEEPFAERWFRRLRRHRTWTIAAAVVLPLLLIVVTAAAIWVEGARRETLRQKDLSDKAKDAEAAQKQIAVEATDDAKRSLVNLQLASGERFQGEGDLGGAMLWYARALPLVSEIDPQSVETHRLRLALLLRHMARPVEVWALPGDQRRQVARQCISPDGRKVVFTGLTIVGVDAGTGQSLWPPLEHGTNDSIPWAGFSPDGSRIITVASPRSMRIWDARTGQPLTRPLDAANDILSTTSGAEGKAELSCDHRWLVVVTMTPSEGRAVEVWDVAAGQRPFPPLEFSESVKAATPSVDGNELMIGSGGELQFFQARDGQPSGRPIAVPGLWHATYSPDGQWIAAASVEGFAQIWHASTREPAHSPFVHRGPVTQVAFSPDSKRLLTLSADRTAQVRDVATGKAIGRAMDHGDRPFSGLFSTDGQRVITVTFNHTVHLWDAETGRQIIAPLRHTTEPAVSATADRVLVAVDGRGGQWDSSRSAEPSDLTIEGIKGIRHLAFSRVGGLLAAASGDQAWLLDARNLEITAGPLAHGGKVQAIAVSPNGRWLATAGDDGTAQLWNMADGTPHSKRLEHEGPISCVRFDPQSQKLLTCSEDQTARLWDAATGVQIGETLAHRAAVRHGDFSPDGTWVITACDDGSARLWNSADGRAKPGDESWVKLSRPEPMEQAEFHPRSEVVLAASRAGRVYVWNPFEPRPQVRIFTTGSGLTTASFSPDGQALLAAGHSNVIHVWNWRTPKQPPASLPVGTVAFHAQFSPDSRVVAAASFDGVQLWEAATGRLVGTGLGPLAQAIAFSPDGRSLVGADGHLRLWDLSRVAYSSETIEKLVNLCSSREIDARGTLQYLSAERIDSLQRELVREIPDDFRPVSRRILPMGATRP